MQLAEIASVDVLLIVAVVAMLVFGSTKIPKMARGLGSAKSEFERGLKEGDVNAAARTEAPAHETNVESASH